MNLYQEWIKAKKTETKATEKRREIEDKIAEFLNVKLDTEATQNFLDDGYKIKVVARFNRKIDSEQLKILAIESGNQDFLNVLFRWKPEISMSNWKATDRSITDILAGAITTTPGRLSYTIEEEKE